MAYEKYITKEDIVAYYGIADPTEIKNIHMRVAQVWVDSQIKKRGYIPSKYDGTYDELAMACLFIIGEELSKMDIITWTPGQVESERIGAVERKFPKWQPMFFFAQGLIGQFDQLLPHETYRMLALAFIKMFSETHDKDKLRPMIRVYKDTSHRGYGWEYRPDYESETKNTSDMPNSSFDSEDQEY